MPDHLIGSAGRFLLASLKVSVQQDLKVIQLTPQHRVFHTSCSGWEVTGQRTRHGSSSTENRFSREICRTICEINLPGP